MMRWLTCLIAIFLLSPDASAQEPTSKHERFERRVHSAAEPLMETEKPATEDITATPVDETSAPTDTDALE